MKHILTATLLGLLAAPAFTAPAFAEGDPAKGEKVFNRCKSCHTIVSDSGENIEKGGRNDPNLWGIAGRTAGSSEGFKYGDDLAAAGAGGLVWDLENFTSFTADPREFLRSHLDDSKAKSKMTFKLKKGAEDLYAFLAQYGPAPEATAEEAASE